MRYTFKIFILLSLLILFVSIFNISYAEKLSPVAQLAQDYILRLNDELRDSNDIVPTTQQEPIIINPETIEKDAIAESIDTITKTVNEIEIEKQDIITEIKETVKDDVDDSITTINTTNTEKTSYELQKSISEEKSELFNSVSDDIDSIEPVEIESEIEKVEDLKVEVEQSLEKIEKNLEEESGVSVNLEKTKEDIKESLDDFKESLIDKKEIIESRRGEFIFKDSDEDGLSDYDEMYIYRTDPNNPRTRGETKTDGEKIEMGINPLSDIEEKIKYQDPREDTESFVSQSYMVEKIELLKDEKKIAIEGLALPNTYIAVYIFSTPIIVTVKTDNEGKWRYELDKELENGEHQIYIATTDNSGKIIARSNPILFTKTAEAATIGITGTLDHQLSNQNFIKDNFILLTICMLVFVVIAGMMIVGNHKTVTSAVNELKKQVSSK